MPFLVLKEVTCQNVNGDTFIHRAGTVLSDWEVSDFVRDKIKEGSVSYRSKLEPLTDQEAHHHRAKATVIEGDHMVDGQVVSAPWEDYVGLHPEEVIERLKSSKDKTEVAQVKLYERGGMRRPAILDYSAPVERAPFGGYDEMPLREVIEKLGVLSDADVQDVIAYESAHRNRPAIISFERDPLENHNRSESSSGSDENQGTKADPVLAGAQEGGLS